jgi:hypothetical protein
MTEQQFNADLHLMLGRIDGKLDMVLSQQVSHGGRLDNHDNHFSDLETRIAQLEARQDEKKTNRSFLMSVGALIVSLAGFLWKLATGK